MFTATSIVAMSTVAVAEVDHFLAHEPLLALQHLQA
jgi:hypothetical protein